MPTIHPATGTQGTGGTPAGPTLRGSKPGICTRLCVGADLVRTQAAVHAVCDTPRSTTSFVNHPEQGLPGARMLEARPRIVDGNAHVIGGLSN